MAIIQKIQQGWDQPRLLNWLLLPVSWIYWLLARLRRFLFVSGIGTVHRIPAPIIVVGNLSVGGTGKTPLVIALVEHLAKVGYSPGVITRGYGGNSTFWPRYVISGDSAEAVGDEALVIARRTGVPVVVGPERVLSARMLVDKYQCNIVISDDGFQHFALDRDLDLVVVDGEKRFGNRWCLPAGPLRESLGGLERADMLIINGNDYSAVERIARNYGFSGSVFAMTVDANTIYRLNFPEQKSQLARLKDEHVHAVAGLGNPTRFIGALELAGIRHSDHLFPDHHQYHKGDFDWCDDHTVVVMTEKDAVKCEHLAIAGEVWVLSATANLEQGGMQQVDDLLELGKQLGKN